MMLWKKSVGESRVDCSRVMVLDGRRHFVLKTSDEHMENEGAKYQQTSGVVRCNIHYTTGDQRGLVVQ